MGRRGPKPLGRRARSLRLPPEHHDLYAQRAEQAGLDWNAYVAYVLATAHGLEPYAAPQEGDQLDLVLEGLPGLPEQLGERARRSRELGGGEHDELVDPAATDSAGARRTWLREGAAGRGRAATDTSETTRGVA